MKCRVRVIVALMAVVAASGVLAQAPPQPKPSVPAQIDRNGVLILVRQTLTALDQANKTGNYTVLRDLASAGFAKLNNAARLAEIFAGERRDRLDLSGVVVLEPQLTVLPEIDAAGRMRMAGFFPSVPSQVNFRLVYEPADGIWRLDEISVNLSPSGPVAPAAPPAVNPPPQAAQPSAPPQTTGKATPPKQTKP